MTRMTAPKIERGAVVGIPVANGSYAGAQVYRPGVNFYLLIFGGVGGEDFDESLLKQTAVLGSWTNDAEVYRGRWKLYGRYPVAAGVFVEPQYRVLLNGVEHRESFDGRRFLPFGDPGDNDGAVFRKIRSPALVQAVVEAYFGEGEWLASYDTMRLVPASDVISIANRSA